MASLFHKLINVENSRLEQVVQIEPVAKNVLFTKQNFRSALSKMKKARQLEQLQYQ